MNSNIQLIQLTVRFEQETQGQHQPFARHGATLLNELAGVWQRVNGRIQTRFNPPHPQPTCSCCQGA